MPPESAQPSFLTPSRTTRRRMGMLTFVIMVTGTASLLMADLLWGSPFRTWAGLVWLLFTLLFTLVAFGAAHAFFGFIIRRQGGDSCAISRSISPDEESSIPLAPTALVLPIHNEGTDRIFAGLQAIYHSLERTGQIEHFHFFILSDSTDPDKWVDEELAWSQAIAKLGAAGRIFYRRRRVNSNKKAGNIADFCRRWGPRYRYMFVLDADSIMSGETIVKLVRLMERNPGAGLIQTAPGLIRAQSLFARALQFAFRLYGPVFQAGLNYWQLGEGNYWGHNAIIRLAPFIKHCALPGLPGREPFGGHILSHDFVEAALLRRAGWAVWLAADIHGSYEELPPTLIDFARRDRRWCQGNLQHFWVLFARGLHGASRMHLFTGIFAYCSSLLWLASLAVGTLLAVGFARTGLTWLPEPALADLVGASAKWQAICLTSFTFILLFVPKLLAVIDRSREPGGLASFGGKRAVFSGIFTECLLSMLVAPVLMLFHAKFVLATIFGSGVRWVTQRRDGYTTWREAWGTHWGHTVVGVIWFVILAFFAPRILGWMTPVLLGLILSVPFSQITSRETLGQRARRRGVFCTPEELAPSPELRELSHVLEEPAVDTFPRAAGEGLARAVLDPYANALHCSLLRERVRQPAGTRDYLLKLQERLLADGPDKLKSSEKNFLLSDSRAMERLHREVWTRNPETLAPVWRDALAVLESTEVVATPERQVVAAHSATATPSNLPFAPETTTASL